MTLQFVAMLNNVCHYYRTVERALNIECWLFIHVQDGLYSSIKSLVTDFRVLVGAPDTPRWNSVLFGGQSHGVTPCTSL